MVTKMSSIPKIHSILTNRPPVPHSRVGWSLGKVIVPPITSSEARSLEAKIGPPIISLEARGSEAEIGPLIISCKARGSKAEIGSTAYVGKQIEKLICYYDKNIYID